MIFAGWSSLVARQAHNLKVVGSNPAPATISARFLRMTIVAEDDRGGFLDTLNFHTLA